MENVVTKMFNYQPIRIIMKEENPWFVTKDVCSALGITNSSDAVSRLDSDEKGLG